MKNNNMFHLSESYNEMLAQQISSIWGVVPCPLPDLISNDTTIHYTSTVYIDLAHTVVTLGCAVLLLLCFNGVQRVTVKNTLNTCLQILPCFRDLEHGATSNTRFVLYYACSSLTALVSLLSLVLDANEVNEGYRVTMQLASRVLAGASAVLLTIALNHQREHRHVDALHGDIGIVQLVGQIRRINHSVVVIYCLYMVAELATSLVDQTHEIRVAMASVSFVIIIILNAPIFAAAVWIVFHKGHVVPSAVARAFLMTGVTFRFVGSIDPSFWNKIALKDWVESDMCPFGGDLAFFNLLQLVDILGQCCIVVFVVSEFRRSRSIVTQESSLIATAQYDEYGEDHSSNNSEGDLQRTAEEFRLD